MCHTTFWWCLQNHPKTKVRFFFLSQLIVCNAQRDHRCELREGNIEEAGIMGIDPLPHTICLNFHVLIYITFYLKPNPINIMSIC